MSERSRKRLSWPPIIDRAREIIEDLDTDVILRQLYYLLFQEGLVGKSDSHYKRLSSLTAEGRREGTFPSLIDPGRTIHRYTSWGGVDHAREWLSQAYRRDRTENQDVSIYLGVEKESAVAQLVGWFGDTGIPILSVRGFSSESYVEAVSDDIIRQDRPAVFIYVGDLDPSGDVIGDNFAGRTKLFDTVTRIGVNLEQIEELDLPVMPGKAKDPRAGAFIEKYGSLFCVEMLSLDPVLLRQMLQDEIDKYWDMSTYEAVLAAEDDDRERLQ